MNQQTNIQKLIRASLVRIRDRSPFFATLAMFGHFIPTQNIDTVGTDGENFYFNPEFLSSLSLSERDVSLLHVVLHAALGHCLRRRARDAYRWNIAADIVVNGMLVEQGFALFEGAIRVPELEHHNVEVIYELLEGKCQGECQYGIANLDLLEGGSQDTSGADCYVGSLSEAKKAELKSYWRNAMQQGKAAARNTNQGKLPAGIERELGSLERSQLDWRSYLWRYLVKTPTDYTGYDRRFIGRGLYLETLQGESVKVYVAVDTSGSINNRQLQMFLSEVRGILSSYPHLECELYYADAAIYGPYELTPNSQIPLSQGGGGTSFIPFFNRVAENWDGMGTEVCVYLTDGRGSFPKNPPQLPVLWVVPPEGLDSNQFPFGEAVRLLSV